MRDSGREIVDSEVDRSDRSLWGFFSCYNKIYLASYQNKVHIQSAAVMESTLSPLKQN
jgi:hypothetical protein